MSTKRQSKLKIRVVKMSIKYTSIMNNLKENIILALKLIVMRCFFPVAIENKFNKISTDRN